MNRPDQIYYYKVYGINLKSEIELPELYRVEHMDQFDLFVSVGHINDELEMSSKHRNWQLNNEWLQFHFSGVIKCQVNRSGSEIILESLSDDAFQVRSFLYSRALSTVLFCRGYYLLHGACVEMNGKAYGFIGESGVGKSTLTMGLMQKGYKVLSDDVVALKLNEGKFWAYPGFKRMRLTHNTFTKMNLSTDAFESIKHYPSKMDFKGDFSLAKHALPLTHLCKLSPLDNNGLCLKDIRGLDKFNCIDEGRYRKVIEALVFNDSDFVTRRVDLASHLIFKNLERPSTRFCLDEMIELIERELV